MRYKEGDKVTIRQWEDMEREFGLIGGDIKVPYAFTENMRRFCGKTLKISNVAGTLYTLEGNRYNWSEGMFENNKLEML